MVNFPGAPLSTAILNKLIRNRRKWVGAPSAGQCEPIGSSLLPDPLFKIRLIFIFAVCVASIVCFRNTLLFPFGILDAATSPTLDVFCTYTHFFHLINGIVVLLIHLFSSQSVTVNFLITAA